MYISLKTGNMKGLRPKILSYHRNIIRMAPGARLIVKDRVHLSTRLCSWPGCCYINLARDSTLHFTGRATIRGEAHIVLGVGAKLIIGDHCILREHLWINAHEEITIGKGSGIGRNCTIIDSDVHPIYVEGKERLVQKPVRVGKNVWIGAHSIVLKGVHIGDESIIGAGSLVTKDIPNNVIAYGRPAQAQRKVDRGKT
jgi:acetyltransferase-like isoleucine patch superfamily enzyme